MNWRSVLDCGRLPPLLASDNLAVTSQRTRGQAHSETRRLKPALLALRPAVFYLQASGQSSNINTTNWNVGPNTENVVGGENQVISLPPVRQQFYRLQTRSLGRGVIVRHQHGPRPKC